MTTKERVTRIHEKKEADRVPITDKPWQGTLSRWRREGMPADVDWREYFDVDKFYEFTVDVSPQYQRRTLEENDDFLVVETEYGVRMKYLKGEDTTPEFLDYKITNPDTWAAAKARINHDSSRINWDYLKENLPKWNHEGAWVDAIFWFGFDVTHSWMCGLETVLIGMLEEPEWIEDIFQTMVDANIALYDQIWDAGLRFDGIYIFDDMGFKMNQFFSVDTYKKLVKPAHKKAIDWANNHGIWATLHSCGMIEPFLPDLVEMGLKTLNPMEVKAGMDPIKLKDTYGDKLTFHGGINAILWEKPTLDEIRAEIEYLVPIMKKNGGYIFATDHSVPNSVSLESFKTVVELAKKIGAY